jgi:anti-sigma factor RsiW
MNQSDYNKLREIAWRQKLTAQQEAEIKAYLAKCPEARPAWEEERILTQSLAQLPDAPLAFNFTAQVLQAVKRQEAEPSPAAVVQWWQRLRSLGWGYRSALAAVVLGAGVLSYQQYLLALSREELAVSIATVSRVAALPRVTGLRDFDTIQHLDDVVAVIDTNLLAALQ